MDEAGVEMAAAVQHNGHYGYDNSYTLDCAQAHPTRFRAVVVLDAEDPHTPGNFANWSPSRHISGLRFTGPKDPHPWLDSDKALQTWATAQDLGLTMDILYAPQRFSAEAQQAFLRVAQKFPRVRIVVDHLGWPALGGAPDFGLERSPPAGSASRMCSSSFPPPTCTSWRRPRFPSGPICASWSTGSAPADSCGAPISALGRLLS